MVLPVFASKAKQSRTLDHHAAYGDSRRRGEELRISTYAPCWAPVQSSLFVAGNLGAEFKLRYNNCNRRAL